MQTEIKQFLETYPRDIDELARLLEAFVLDSAPGCTETLHSGWKVISFGYKKKFCAIGPHSKWVNLQFHNGAMLIDSNRMLEGTGKSMRHIKLKNPSGLNDILRLLIQQASANAK